MKDKLIQQYTEKLGVPPCNDRDQVILDLQIFGVASPSFGAAHTLNLLIHGAFVIYSDAAMKAQEQARKTLQTLHDIKNPKPRTVFIKNAIAQQVNQLVTKTEELQKQLEDRPYAKVDFGGTEIAERSHEVIDLPAASVGTIAEGRPRVNDEANKRGRKSKSSKELL